MNRTEVDMDRLAGALLYALIAGMAFAVWRESWSAGAFVFFALLPLNLGVSQ